MFDEFIYDADFAEEQNPRPPNDDEDEPDLSRRTIFEVNLQVMIDCLNVFGTANASANATNAPKKHKFTKWDTPDGGDEASSSKGKGSTSGSRNGRIDQYMGNGSGTALKMTYTGPGHPLVLHLCVSRVSALYSVVLIQISGWRTWKVLIRFVS